MNLPPILYHDAHILVINKPAGLAVTPPKRGGLSLADMLDELRLGFQRRPEPAHRLDRDTSGCLLLGRHAKALKRLGELFQVGAVKKLYVARVAGAPPAGEGLIDAPLQKVSSAEKGWRVVVDPAGRPSVTRYRLMERGAVSSLVELTPETGRTHQLRVHLAHIGCPILGDPVYAPAEVAAAAPRLLLHAAALRLQYRPGWKEVAVEAPLPTEFRLQDRP